MAFRTVFSRGVAVVFILDLGSVFLLDLRSVFCCAVARVLQWVHPGLQDRWVSNCLHGFMHGCGLVYYG